MWYNKVKKVWYKNRKEAKADLGTSYFNKLLREKLITWDFAAEDDGKELLSNN